MRRNTAFRLAALLLVLAAAIAAFEALNKEQAADVADADKTAGFAGFAGEAGVPDLSGVEEGRGMTEGERVVYRPKAVDIAGANPYIGLAPWAEGGPYSQPHSLVYANWSWSEIEPEQGVYDFDGLERKYKLDDWSRQGVRLIFRVVLDYPRPEARLDIPEWLYEELGGDGVWYSYKWGNGFSPNYMNPQLIARHGQLIRALGDKYNNDPRIAYIQIGSIGHWGEWHTIQDGDLHIPFPELDIAEQYVRHYIEYFPDKMLMMRRPHQIAIDHGMGLYNDMFGDKTETLDEFWSWVENGYESWLTEETHPAMPDYWQHAPTGGEFAPRRPWRSFFGMFRLGKTIRMAETVHMSWIGPNTPADYPKNGPLQKGIDKLLDRVGYRFRVEEAVLPRQASPGEDIVIDMVWLNEGVAPFYREWPLELSLIDGSGQAVVRQRAESDVRDWLPGRHRVSERLGLPATLGEGTYRVAVAIPDPEGISAGIRLAMEGGLGDGRYVLGELAVTGEGSTDRTGGAVR